MIKKYDDLPHGYSIKVLSICEGWRYSVEKKIKEKKYDKKN